MAAPDVTQQELVVHPDCLHTMHQQHPCLVLSSSPQESINIWWINDALRSIGLSPLVSTPCNPVSEAVFNFVLAWAGMFLPVLLTDGASQKVEKKVRGLAIVPGLGVRVSNRCTVGLYTGPCTEPYTERSNALHG
jgi:hypothetical protein